MATVAETELEQKTSEYVSFVKEFFSVSGNDVYSTKQIKVAIDGDSVFLQYKGK